MWQLLDLFQIFETEAPDPVFTVEIISPFGRPEFFEFAHCRHPARCILRGGWEPLTGSYMDDAESYAQYAFKRRWTGASFESTVSDTQNNNGEEQCSGLPSRERA